MDDEELQRTDSKGKEGELLFTPETTNFIPALTPKKLEFGQE